MKLPIADILISDQLIKALCNTLLHSLWQGILLAAAGGLIVVFTKKASAVTRYNLLITAMLLFIGGIVYTFSIQVPHFTTTTTIAASANNAAVNIINVPVVNHINTPANITQTITGYFNSNYKTIVLIWFLMICAKGIQMAVGLHGVYYLKRKKISAVSQYWQNRVAALSQQLGINQAIGLLESGIAKVPMVIGHLKPVILIPIGLVNALSADEVEAILIHELAHIRRRDYLVNLLQSLMEIVFFFNPAVLWISSLIKAERENCCDDIAVTQTSSRSGYINALVSCEEYQLSVPAYAMAFPGGKSSLINRVKRMASKRNHSLNIIEKTLLTICLVVTGLGLSAYSAREQIKHTIHTVVSAIHHVELNNVEQQKLNEQTALLKKQDTAIRQNMMKVSIKPIMAKVDTVAPVQVMKVNITPVALNAENVSKVTIAPVARLNSSLGKLSNIAIIDTIIAPMKIDVKLSNINIQPVPKLTVKVAPVIKIDTTIRITVNVAPKLDVKSVSKVSVQTEAKAVAMSAPIAKIQTEPKLVTKVNVAPKVFSKPNPAVDEVIDLLIKENIIKSKNDLDFKITNDEFIVNGVKQPKALQQKALSIFRSKSTTTSEGTFNYSYSNHIN